jgi:hypothetical protein
VSLAERKKEKEEKKEEENLILVQSDMATPWL